MTTEQRTPSMHQLAEDRLTRVAEWLEWGQSVGWSKSDVALMRAGMAEAVLTETRRVMRALAAVIDLEHVDA